jgi:hypothetical protein
VPRSRDIAAELRDECPNQETFYSLKEAVPEPPILVGTTALRKIYDSRSSSIPARSSLPCLWRRRSISER